MSDKAMHPNPRLRPPTTSVWLRLQPGLKTWGEGAGHVLAIWTFATGVVLAWMHLATGAYLAAFGQLGSSAFGDTAGFLAAILPTIIQIVIAFVGLALFPMLPGFVSGAERHAFRGAFGNPPVRAAFR